MRATNSQTNGLVPIGGCFLSARGKTIFPHVLPDISDKHSATFSDEQIMGRSMPVKSYASSSDRTISWKWKFVNTDRESYIRNLEDYNFLKSLTYPIDNPSGSIPYEPPPICQIKCGGILAADKSQGYMLNAICTDCSASFPTDVVWTSFTDSNDGDFEYMPVEFNVDTTFSIVYRASDLPGQSRIMKYGG
jgi:hypothetical protein